MLPWIPAAIQAVASIVGVGMQNREQKRQARDAMAFSERMANTSAQRAKADFEAAGLNPALAYGTQAASPMGQQASIQNELGGAVSSAIAARQASQAIQIGKEQLKVVAEQAKKAKSEAVSADLDVQKRSVEQMVWNAVATGQKVDLGSPLAKSILSQFEATALAPESIRASNSALTAQANASRTSAAIQDFERKFLDQMQTDKGNVSKIMNMVLPILRMLK